MANLGFRGTYKALVARDLAKSEKKRKWEDAKWYRDSAKRESEEEKILSDEAFEREDWTGACFHAKRSDHLWAAYLEFNYEAIALSPG